MAYYEDYSQFGRRRFLHGASLALGGLLGAGGTLGLRALFSRGTPRGRLPMQAADSRPAAPWPEDFNPSTALSLRALQAKLRKAARASGTASLEGFVRIRGISVETDGDVLLLGDRDPALPPIEVDDLTIALRSAYQANETYGDAPGCTIDPRQGAADPWQIQDAKILGMPRTAAMGARFLAADYELKKVSVGVLSLGGAQDLFKLSRTAAPFCDGAGDEGSKETVHRFWFCPSYPEPPRFLQDPGAVWIRRPARVQLLTEKEFLDKNARRTGGKAADPLAQRFASIITGMLEEAQIPQYARMRADFRTLEAGKLIRYLGAGREPLRYLLEERELAAVSTPAYVGGIWREESDEVVCDHPVTEERTASGVTLRSRANVRRERQRVTGGVEARLETPPGHFAPGNGQLATAFGRARSMRPSADAVSWSLA